MEGGRVRLMDGWTRAPRLRYARPGANPSLSSIEYVRAILEQSEAPIRRESILSVLASWGDSTELGGLNSIIEFFGDEGAIAEGSKGLVWAPHASGRLAAA